MSGSPEADPTTTGPDRHWFVAINDVDVGPIDIAEVEARWRAGELDATSLAWRPGMAEWQTINTVPELAYLLEQIEPAMAETAMPVVQWVTANAVSLDDLVAMELDDPTVAATPAPMPTTQSIFADNESMGLPDLSSLGFGGQKQQWDDGWGVPAPSGPASFPPGPAPWLEHETDHSKRNLMVVLIGGGFLVLTLGLVLAIVELVKGSPAPAPRAQVAALKSTPKAEAPALEPVAVTPPAPETAPKPVTKPTPKPKPSAKPTRRPTPPRKRPPPQPKKEEPAVGTKLSKSDILRGIKRNATNLMPCLKAARAKSEVPAGSIKFVLNWTIEADGSVSQPKLRGPARVLNTSLPGCFSAKMRQWKFPGSSRSSNIKNFGLPIKLR